MSQRYVLTRFLFLLISIFSVGALLTSSLSQDSSDRIQHLTWEESDFTTIQFNRSDCIICSYGFIEHGHVRYEDIKQGSINAVGWCEIIGWVRCHVESEIESKDGFILYTAIVKKYFDIEIKDGYITCPFNRSRAIDKIKDYIKKHTGIKPTMKYIDFIDYPEDIIQLIKQVEYERL